MQYKTLVNPSFVVLMLEVQEHLNAGWYIDENNLPSANFTYYEVHLLLDEHREAVKEVFGEDSAVIDFSKIASKEGVEKQEPKKVSRPKAN